MCPVQGIRLIHPKRQKFRDCGIILQQMRKVLFALFLVLICEQATYAAAPDEFMTRYIEAFNEGAPAEVMVQQYFKAPVTLYMPDEIRVLESDSAVADWLQEVSDALSDAGWVGTEITETAMCHANSRMIIYGVQFVRHFNHRISRESAAGYILINSDGWQIAGVLFADPNVLLGCLRELLFDVELPEAADR